MSRALWVCASALVLVGAGCGAAYRPFADRPVVWQDDDARPFAPRPSEIYNPWAWDEVDNLIFRQVSDALAYRRRHEAVDVNALDEVPDSTWFTNRLSRRDMTLDELGRGSCVEATPPPPYVITRGKTSGSSPGALVRASDGRTYLLKTDFWQPERGTAADAIATRLLHAAGYETPCNVVVFVREADLSIEPGALRRRGGDALYTHADLEHLLAEAGDGPDGTRRVSLSRYLEGIPRGGFRFSGVRGDDPNDVVLHEDRRELRALYVLSAWMNHIDARAENNLDLWMEAEDGRGYLRHVILDAGDSFGIWWADDIDEGMSRRFGNAHYLDIEQILGDIATLGLADRAYRFVERGPAFEVLGFFDVERFDPDDWRNGYPNRAFEQRTEADCAWMARIIARFDEPALRAIVATGRFSLPLYDDELVRILLGRRERLLERYLLRLSPLAFADVSGGRLCMRDLAVESGLRERGEREHGARAFEGIPPTLTRASIDVEVDPTDGSVCVELPRTTTAELPRYHVVDLFSGTVGREHSHPARVHLWEVAPGEHHLAGLERPDSDDVPR